MIVYPFNVGDLVGKPDGDYRFNGVVIGVSVKRSGEVRYTVEDDRGTVHVFSAKQLVIRTENPKEDNVLMPWKLTEEHRLLLGLKGADWHMAQDLYARAVSVLGRPI